MIEQYKQQLLQIVSLCEQIHRSQITGGLQRQQIKHQLQQQIQSWIDLIRTSQNGDIIYDLESNVLSRTVMIAFGYGPHVYNFLLHNPRECFHVSQEYEYYLTDVILAWSILINDRVHERFLNFTPEQIYYQEKDFTDIQTMFEYTRRAIQFIHDPVFQGKMTQVERKTFEEIDRDIRNEFVTFMQQFLRNRIPILFTPQEEQRIAEILWDHFQQTTFDYYRVHPELERILWNKMDPPQIPTMIKNMYVLAVISRLETIMNYTWVMVDNISLQKFSYLISYIRQIADVI